MTKEYPEFTDWETAAGILGMDKDELGSLSDWLYGHFHVTGEATIVNEILHRIVENYESDRRYEKLRQQHEDRFTRVLDELSKKNR